RGDGPLPRPLSARQRGEGPGEGFAYSGPLAVPMLRTFSMLPVSLPSGSVESQAFGQVGSLVGAEGELHT
ncbi:MAG: hypothetical protein AB7U18_14595, partial [Dehalococcoidia bacterium]